MKSQVSRPTKLKLYVRPGRSILSVKPCPLRLKNWQTQRIPPERLTAFFDKFSLQFGEVDKRYHVPAPTHPLMRRPFIKQNGTFFCPVSQTAYWSLRPAIEEFLNPRSSVALVHDDVIWQKYLRIRSIYLEEKAICKYLCDTLLSLLKHFII